MGRTRKKTNFTGRVIPVTNRPFYALDRTVEALNGKLEYFQVHGPDEDLAQKKRMAETPGILREFVEAWRASGSDLFKFRVNERQKWADLNRHWHSTPLELIGAPGGGAAFFMTFRLGSTPYEEALRLFMELLLNPECNRIAGPCHRCGKYYARRSVRNKVYCSRTCGTRATALAATKQRRDVERSSKLRRAAILAKEWISCKTEMDWRQWISRRDPEITPKFLTRAVNAKFLAVPIRSARKER